MELGIEWLKNKVHQKFFPVTHAKAVLRGDSNVDTDMSVLEQSVKKSQETVDQLQKDFDEVDLTQISTHLKSNAVSDDGAHGLRYKNNALQYNDGSKWVDVEVGSNGAAPNDMRFVSTTLGTDGTSLILNGIDPNDTVVDSIVISKWAGTKIVRKVGSYPTKPSDGVLVVDYQTRNQYASQGFVDTGLVTGQTYYYRWFPYSDQGAINTSTNNAVNRTSAAPKSYTVVGVTVDLSNNTFARTDDAIGLTAGSSFNKFGMYGKRRRCIVADDGTILAFYGDNGYTETGKLTKKLTVNGQNYTIGTSCQVMVYQPKFYYRVTPVTMVENPNKTGKMVRKATYQIADSKYAGFKTHPAFIRDGVEVPYILLSAFEASTQKDDGTYINDNLTMGTKLSSIAGALPATYITNIRFTRQFARTLANSRGSGWDLLDALAVSCTQLLFMIEYATMNSQTAIGSGNVNASAAETSNIIKTGLISLGNNSGVSSDSKTVVYRGEENLWGNVWTWIDGINIYNNNSGIAFIADHGYVDAVTSAPYASTEYNFARGTGYVSALGYSANCDFMFIAAEITGTSANPVGDQFISNYTNGSMTVATLGGHITNGLAAGLFAWSFKDQMSDASVFIGARLMHVPVFKSE